jgi:hypothetical protein
MNAQQFQAINQHSKIQDGVLIVIMPLKEKGYLINDVDLGDIIFVKSGLPAKERSLVVRSLLRRSKDA